MLNKWDENIIKKLREKDLITVEQADKLRDCASASEKCLADLIQEDELVDSRVLLTVLSEEFLCPPISPSNFRIADDIIEKVPTSFVKKHRVIPISIFEDTLTVAMENPNEITVVDDLQAITNMRIRPVVSLPSEIKSAMQRYYAQVDAEEMQRPEETMDDLIRIVAESKDQDSGEKAVDLMKLAQETPIIKVANILLVEAIKRRASDLFIEPWEKSIRVRCRVDGLLEEMKSPPKSMGNAIVSRFKVMSNLDIAERRLPQDGRFRVKIQDRAVDIRVSILPTCFGEKVCLRVLDKTVQSHSLDRLGFTEVEQQQIKSGVLKPHGMILVTGPTGSGKTTTLYSILKFLDSPETNITTVEDPVEYQMEGINQVNVRENIGLTFPLALRSILRQDPDIILIGEIRDLITMDIAIKSALTGHLVLSTLHTNDTASSIVRMINMGIEPFLITSSLLAITAQRLVRKLCKACKIQYDADAETVKRLNLDRSKKNVLFRPGRCAKCRQTGFSGRSVITEILVVTPKMKELILKNVGGEQIKLLARRQGMTTLRQSCVHKALMGETSVDEVFRVTVNDQKLLEAA